MPRLSPLAAVALLVAAPAFAADGPPQGVFDRLITAVEKNDIAAMQLDATDKMKAALTPALLAAVSRDLAPHLQAGYTATYLGDLKQKSLVVHLWKLTFKDGRDDALVKLALSGDQVAGFFIQ